MNSQDVTDIPDVESVYSSVKQNVADQQKTNKKEEKEPDEFLVVHRIWLH